MYRSDVEAWRRKKEIEAGVAIGSSAPHPKRPKLDRRPVSDEELATQLADHKTLMRGSVDAPASADGPTSTATPIVYDAPQTYAAPPIPDAPTPAAPEPATAPAPAPAPFPDTAPF